MDYKSDMYAFGLSVSIMTFRAIPQHQYFVIVLTSQQSSDINPKILQGENIIKSKSMQKLNFIHHSIFEKINFESHLYL